MLDSARRHRARRPDLGRRPSSLLTTCTAAVLVLAVGAALGGSADPAGPDPFGFLAPWVVVSSADRQRLDRDEVIARTLPAGDGQLAVFAAARLDASPDALVAWTRQIAALKRSRFVEAIGRFSDPPSLADLSGLTLDERDLHAICECEPGNCALKLPATDIAALVKACGAGGTSPEVVQAEFRRLLVARVAAYRAGGLEALPPAADRSTPRRIDEAFGAILDDSPYLVRLPGVATWLRDYPRAGAGNVESFLYWSKEFYGRGKPVVSVTHVGIVRHAYDGRLPLVMVVGKQIFATHYVNGALGVTLIVRDARTGVDYLVYLNRSQVDILKGFWAVFVRGIIEKRVSGQAPDVVRGLRTRLESGNPPKQGDTPAPTR